MARTAPDRVDGEEGGKVRPFLTVRDVARTFSVGERAARAMLERGDIPGFRLGRCWYVRPEALDAWARAREAEYAHDRDAVARSLRGA